MKNILFVLLICIVTLNAKINSYVTILPQKYFVQQIVGNKITIRSMFKNQYDIDKYAPSRKQKNTVSRYIDLYFTFNLMWEKKYINEFKSLNKKLKVIQLIDFDDKKYDEYRWLDPIYVKNIAKKIYKNMIKIDPNNKKIYMKNYGIFLDKLDSLYINLKRFFSNRNSKVYVFDDSFRYYFDRFNLKSELLKFNRSFLTTKEILNIKKHIKQNNIKAILLLNNKYKKEASIISKSTGIKVINIDIFGYNWLFNMNKISEAFR